MEFKIQLVIDDGQGEITIEDVIHLERQVSQNNNVGLSLVESKHLLKSLQQKIVLCQAQDFSNSQNKCPCCSHMRRVKSYHTTQFRSLFGIVAIPSIRLYHCPCENNEASKTFSPLAQWLPEHTSPELQYLETKWASLMSYELTAKLLQDVLPISATQNAATVRNHLHKVAQRQEDELVGQPDCISGCPRDWGNLPKPDKPLTVGIDGGYLRNWHAKNTNFEVIAGKSYSKTQTSKRFGFIQSIDPKPRRRLMHVLSGQGMQANQQITFLSDGADNVRDLQYIMYPESEHVLDWFHVTMRMTVLSQFAKGLKHSDPAAGKEVGEELESAKWYLWHGNVEKALHCLDDFYMLCDDEELHYGNCKKLLRHLSEMSTYIENNRHLIPNYGEKWRYGEAISTGFVESTINEVVAKRMVKKQQMQWTQQGAHYLLQTRTAVLNEELGKHFERWYPGLKIGSEGNKQPIKLQKAA